MATTTTRRKRAAAPTTTEAAVASPATEPAQSIPSVALLPLAAIRESATNPRRTYDHDAMGDLVESVRAHGILQPVLVRSSHRGLQDGYELVFGHRRVRAAREAGLQFVPAMVRSMGDREVLEAQVIENCQRQDVPILEEADGYLRLHETYGLEAQEIAAKVGKSVSLVYGRMKLAGLCKQGREALIEGRILASVALLVARLPTEEAQKEALLAVTAYSSDEPMSHALARGRIETRVMRSLSRAAWDVNDSELCPASGACSSCPNRSGVQAKLFAEVASEDRCLDADCFDTKLRAHWAALREAHVRSGGEVLLGDAARAIPEWSDEYVSLDGRCHRDPEQRFWRDLLSDLPREHVIMVEGDGGRFREVVRRDIAYGHLPARDDNEGKSGASTGGPGPRGGSSDYAKQRAREEAAQKAARRIVDATIPVVVTAIEEASEAFIPGILAIVAREVIDLGGCARVLERREFDSDEALVGALPDMTAPELLGLLVELSVPSWLDGEVPSSLVDVCSVLGLPDPTADLKAALGEDQDEYADVVPEDEEGDS